MAWSRSIPHMQTRPRTRVTALVALLAVVTATPAFAQSADTLFEDGNRLFRDDLYWAALLRYRQARDAGLNTPLLAYNTGVAHYKAGQHNRARDELKKAARASSLEVVAHYNLGLNAFKAGNPDEALDWFRLARDQQQNAKISSLAKRAIGRINRLQKAADPVVVRAEERRQREKKKFANLELHAKVGFGNDDNVFRSPAEPYVDLSDPNQPTVTPEPQSGAYMPVSFGAKYLVNSLKYEGFYGAYRLRGRYYQDKELENANEYRQELSFGNEYYREQEDRKTQVDSAFKIVQADETYYDPDDGLAREVNGIDISDRYDYLRYGPELRFRKSWKRLTMGGIIKGQLWDYESIEEVPEYDHEYFTVGLHTQYKFTRTSLIRVNVETFSRRYSDRPSYNLDAQQVLGNPSVRYDYLEAGIIARQRIMRSMWFGVGYERTDREDRFEGYNNYIRDQYEFEYHWSLGRRLDFDIDAYYRIYNYENAFAFNELGQPRKTLETAAGQVKLAYRMTPSLTLELAGLYREAVSNDLRLQYERTEYSLSVVWEP